MGNLFGKTCYNNKQLSKEDKAEDKTEDKTEDKAEDTKKLVPNLDITIRVTNKHLIDSTVIKRLLDNETIFENIKDVEEKEVEKEVEKEEKVNQKVNHYIKEFLEDSNKKLFLD